MDETKGKNILCEIFQTQIEKLNITILMYFFFFFIFEEIHLLL